MPIPFTCPHCQRTGRLPDTFTGDKIKCPACQTVSPISRPSASKSAASGRNRALADAETEPMLKSPTSRAGGARGKAEPAAKTGVPIAVIVGGSVGTGVLAIIIAVVIVVMSRPTETPQPKVAQGAPRDDSAEAAPAPAAATATPVPVAAAPTSSPTAVPTTAAPLNAVAGGNRTPTAVPSAGASVTTLGTTSTPVESPEETVQRIKDATVYIEVKSSAMSGGSGSGFVIQVSGDTVLVASNHHVVAAGADDDDDDDPGEAVKKGMVTVYFRSGRGAGVEQSAPGTVIAWDREGNRDLAIIQVKGVKNPPKPIVLSSDFKMTETMPVLIYGFPFGNIDKGLNNAVQGGPSITVAKGSISSLRLNEHGKVSYVQIDSSMNHGNSGGPVCDEKGRLVGVAVSKLRDSTIGFAVPTAELLQMLDGRLSHLSIAFKAEKDGKADLQVVTRVIDPLHKINSVNFLFVPATGPTQALPKLNADGTWPALPGATPVRMGVKNDLAAVAIETPNNAGAGRRLFVQASYLDGLGRTIYTNPIAYDIPTEPTGLVAIGLPPSREGPKIPPTFEKLGPLVDASKQCKMTRDSKFLAFDVPAGVHLLSPELDVKNSPMSLADVDRDFVAQVQIVGEMLPGVEKPRFKGRTMPITFQGAGLIFWVDKNNYIRLERTAGTGGELTMINKLLVEACKNGKDVGHRYIPVPEGPLFVRMTRVHSALQCMVSTDGHRWAALPKLPVSYPMKAQIGLCASNVSKEPCTIRFENFVLITEPKKVKDMVDR